MSEKKNTESGFSKDRRRALSAFASGLAVGAVATVVTNWEQIERWLVGRTGSQNRNLQWFAPETVIMPEGTDWMEFDEDPDALGNIHRTWKRVGHFLVSKEMYEGIVDGYNSEGLTTQQAFAYTADGRVEMGIARSGDDPSFFGESDDGESYSLAAKCGRDGLTAAPGLYIPEKGEFVAVQANSLPPVELSVFLAENPKATWV